MRPWSRLSAVALATALTVTVSACSRDGDTTATPAPAPSTTPTPVTTPAATTEDPTPTKAPKPSKNGPVTEYNVICADPDNLKPFTGPAAIEFGQDEVLDAYCEMADFFFVHGVSNLMQESEDYNGEELRGVMDYLTPDAQKDWQDIMAGVKKGDEDAAQRARSLIYYDIPVSIAFPDFSWPTPSDDVPTSVGGGVSKADAAVHTGKSGRAYLGLMFEVDSNLGLVKDGKPYALPVTRKVSLYLVPSNSKDPARSWLINSWNNEYRSTSKPKPLSQLIGN